MQNKHVSKLPMFLTSFIDLFGVGILIPLLPALFFGHSSLFFANSSDQFKTMMLGVLVGIYPLAQFFGAPILGALSDRFGRRPVLIFSILGTVIGYLLFAFGIITGNVWLLYLGRMLDGFTGGNISTIYSALADVSDKEDKAKNFGIVGMGFGLGLVLGPFFGGKLSDSSLVSWFGINTPFLFGALLASINLVLVYFTFPETLAVKTASRIDPLIGFKNILKASTLKNLRVMFLVQFLLSFGFNLFVQFFSVYLFKRFNFTEGQIGTLFGYVGLWIAFSQGVVTRYVAKYFSPRQVLPIALMALAISLLVLSSAKDDDYLYVILPFVAIFEGLVVPNYSAILSDLGDEKSQGEIMGVSQSLSSLSQVVPPFIDGIIINIGVSLPLIFSSLITICAWGVFEFVYKKRTPDYP